ncbi:TetR/AcrR family transcriptional regulator [Rummeliibacillus sp. TYF-LIM-RU47]|uniref:TetR/AcrR family transcriptional regulator n=1 Tax=Rummeliibacillus sp. TYF-LIM-RU47 TaxID=2608406 RepID=UPI0012398AEB|nr:TetR/AcrR family transcriptional regulator [Rummeliibacillus sp. TYF-LIM-RU47]
MASKKRGRPVGRPKQKNNDISTREVILQVATRLFLEHGFQRVSMDDIARNSETTKATVYYYYETKAELFKETMVALMERIQERILFLLTSDKPLYDRLLDVTTAHLKATTTLDLDGFMRESKQSLTEEQMGEMKKAEEKMYEGIENEFKKAIDSGEIPHVNTKFAAHAYLALIRVGNYKQADGLSIFESAETSAIQILDVFWNGFFKK